jgi:membrane protein implicated in regulation of membrane protease activity
MSNAVMWWLIAGAALVVAELTTGTLYLLVFGIAAWAGAGAAYFGYGIPIQLTTAGVASLVGLAILIPYDIRRRAHAPASNIDQEIGNDATVEMVLAGGKLRVNYRGSTWDAVMDSGATAPNPGESCTITEVRGNTLVLRPRS